MASRLVISPNYLLSPDAPVIFLAGPIQGADDWQKDAARIIEGNAPDLYVANPRREIITKGEFSTILYNEQVDWETHHLRLAGKDGVVLFWLARELEHRCDRAYAQTTRFELAEWKMRHERDGSNLVLGIEEGFTGSRYILRRFGQDCHDVPISNSLEETCENAIRLCRNKR